MSMKRILVVLLACLSCSWLAAEDFVLRGVVYTTTPEGTVMVVGYTSDLPEDVAIPSVVNSKAVASMRSSAFAGCTSMKTIVIPGSITTISNDAFSGCTALSSVELSDGIAAICRNAFDNCVSLPSLDIPGSITEIQNDAFKGCTSLRNLVLEDGDKELMFEKYFQLSDCPLDEIYYGRNLSDKSSPFAGHSSLGKITIGTHVTTIVQSAFSGCAALKHVVIMDDAKSLDITGYEFPLFAGSPLEKVYVGRNLSYLVDGFRGPSPFQNQELLSDVTIGENVTELGQCFFSGCTSLSTITIPGNVKSIGPWAFQLCASLSSVSMLHGVTTIGDSAFDRCTSLVSVTIPNSVVSVDNDAFEECSALKNVVLEDGEEPLEITGYYTSLFADNPLEEVYWGRNMTHAPDCPPFGNQARLSKVTIGRPVTEIKSSYFSGCTSLVSMDIPETVTVIKDRAFKGCTSLVSVNIPKELSTLEEYTFDGCSSLPEITIPNNVTLIKERCFWGCSSLRKLIIEDGTKSITAETPIFRDSPLEEVYWGRDPNFQPFGQSLKKVVIGENITYIDDWTFIYCASLTSVVLPNGVTSIGDFAFSDCTSLPTITIPSAVTSIGDGAFMGCKSLKEIRSLNSIAPTIQAFTFEGVDTVHCKLLVPKGCADSYRSNILWNMFRNISDELETSIATLPAVDTDFECHVQNGTIVVCGISASQPVYIYDINGRLCCSVAEHDGIVRYRAVSGGLYVVRAGKHAKKVVVGDGSVSTDIY